MTDTEQLVFDLQTQIEQLHAQIVLKDKQIKRQGEVIRSVQRAVGAGSFPLDR